MTTTESIPGSGQTQVSGGGQNDSLAARRRSKAKNMPKKDLSRRARQVRPTTNHQNPHNDHETPT